VRRKKLIRVTAKSPQKKGFKRLKAAAEEKKTQERKNYFEDEDLLKTVKIEFGGGNVSEG